MGDLFEHYRAFNDVITGLEEPTLAAFEALMPDPAWKPVERYLAGYARPQEIGLLACLLNADADAEPKLRDAAAAVVAGRAPEGDTLAELHVAGLLRHLGFAAALLPTRKGLKTPDIHGPDLNPPVDVEVVRGALRPRHQEFQASVSALHQRVQAREHSDLAIYLHREVAGDDFAVIAYEAARLEVGTSRDLDGLCRIVALPGGDQPPQDAPWAPDHWSEKGAKFLATSVSMGSILGRVHIEAFMPPATYLNTVKRKAERPQRTGDLPYLIAVDVMQFPNAMRDVVAELETPLTDWPHVSGVLMVMPFFFTVSFPQWRARLIPNPSAAKPLPAPLLGAIPHRETTFEVMRLTSGQDTDAVECPNAEP